MELNASRFLCVSFVLSWYLRLNADSAPQPSSLPQPSALPPPLLPPERLPTFFGLKPLVEAEARDKFTRLEARRNILDRWRREINLHDGKYAIDPWAFSLISDHLQGPLNRQFWRLDLLWNVLVFIDLDDGDTTPGIDSGLADANDCDQVIPPDECVSTGGGTMYFIRPEEAPSLQIQIVVFWQPVRPDRVVPIDDLLELEQKAERLLEADAREIMTEATRRSERPPSSGLLDLTKMARYLLKMAQDMEPRLTDAITVLVTRSDCSGRLQSPQGGIFYFDLSYIGLGYAVYIQYVHL